MTFRGLGAALLATLAVAACSDGRWGYDGYYRDYGPPRDPCLQYTTCGSCTPVLGCGWCGTGENPGGECHNGPDQCSGTTFTWAWESNGCYPNSAPPAHDGGVTTPSDASTPRSDSSAPLTLPADASAPVQSHKDAASPGSPPVVQHDAAVPDAASDH